MDICYLLPQGVGGQVSRRLVHDPCPVWAVRVSSTAGAGPASTLQPGGLLQVASGSSRDTHLGQHGAGR